uniref:UDP-N-acetylglucosamine transferase subunit ALG13 n=1 Tax=Lygus hesperus TaxID=30085 RepID=A0A0A9ZGQ7_LYGHE
MDLSNVFVTVGTTQFDLLIKVVTSPDCIQALKKRGCKRLKLQIGSGSHMPANMDVDGVEITSYRYKDSIKDDMSWANFVISHAGAGSCLEALELEKPLLVVVNTNLMDNHQFEVATKLKDCGYLHYTTCDDLLSTLCNLDLSRLRPYPKHDPLKFTSVIDYIMGFR